MQPTKPNETNTPTKAKWLRIRFFAPGIADDPRPVAFPPPGPWWCSGIRGSDDAAVIIAYVREESQIAEYWPEAEDLDVEECEEIFYSDRFPKPKWYEVESDGN